VTEVEEMDTGPLGNMDRAAREKAEEDGRGVAEVVLKDFRDVEAEATDEDEDEDGRCPGNTQPSLPTETRFFRAGVEEDAEDLLSLLARTTADRTDHGVGEEEEEERRGGEEEDYAEGNAEDDARHQEAAVRFERSPIPPPDEDERYFLCSPLPPSRPSLLLRLRNPRL
jgi:hypothetical protein